MDEENKIIYSEDEINQKFNYSENTYDSSLNDLNNFLNPKENKGLISQVVDTAKIVGFNETAQGIVDRAIQPLKYNNEAGYNPYDQEQIKTKDSAWFERFGDRLDRVRSDEEFHDVMREIGIREVEEQEWANADLNNFAVIAGIIVGGFGDITSAIYPVGFTAKLGLATYTALNTGIFAGTTALRDQMSDTTYLSNEDKLYNIGTSALLGGTISGAIALRGSLQFKKSGQVAIKQASVEELQKAEYRRFKQIDESIDTYDPNKQENPFSPETDYYDFVTSGGDIKLAEGSGATGWIFKKFLDAPILNKISPETVGWNSPISAGRVATARLMGTNLETTAPIKVPLVAIVETEFHTINNKARFAIDEIYREAKKANPNMKLTLDEFGNEMYSKVSSGDYSQSAFKELDPYFQKARKVYIDTTEKLAERNKLSGIFDESADTSSKVYKAHNPDHDLIQKDIGGATNTYTKALVAGNIREAKRLGDKLGISVNEAKKVLNSNIDYEKNLEIFKNKKETTTLRLNKRQENLNEINKDFKTRYDKKVSELQELENKIKDVKNIYPEKSLNIKYSKLSSDIKEKSFKLNKLDSIQVKKVNELNEAENNLKDINNKFKIKYNTESVKLQELENQLKDIGMISIDKSLNKKYVKLFQEVEEKATRLTKLENKHLKKVNNLSKNIKSLKEKNNDFKVEYDKLKYELSYLKKQLEDTSLSIEYGEIAKNIKEKSTRLTKLENLHLKRVNKLNKNIGILDKNTKVLNKKINSSEKNLKLKNSGEASELRRYVEASRLSDEKASREFAENYIDNLLKGNLISTIGNTVEAKSLNFSKMNLDEDIIAPFVSKNFQASMSNMIRSQTVAQALQSQFGDTNFSKLFKTLDEETNKYVKDNKLIGEEASKVFNHTIELKKNFVGVTNRMMGRQFDGRIANTSPDIAINYLRSLTTAGLMGKAVFSQIPDLAQLMFNWKSVGKEAAKNFKETFGAISSKLTKGEKEILSYRARHFEDFRFVASDATEGGALSNASRLPNQISAATYELGLVTYWNNVTQGFATDNVTDALMKLASKKSKLTPQEKFIIADMGLSEKDLPKILEQAKKHGKVSDNGTYFVDLTEFEGRLGVNVRAAIFKEMRKSIITPNVAARPALVDNSWLGKMFGQFKGFMFSGYRNFWLRDLQAGGAIFATRAAIRTFGGMTAYVVREMITKDFDEIDMDPATLAHEGMIRGGAFAGVDFVGDVLDQFNMGPSRLLGTARSVRRSRGFNQGTDVITRTVAGAPLVPIADIGKTLSNISQGKTDYNSYKHLMKYPFGHFAAQAAWKRWEKDWIKQDNPKDPRNK